MSRIELVTEVAECLPSQIPHGSTPFGKILMRVPLLVVLIDRTREVVAMPDAADLGESCRMTVCQV
jgi:hypothetical protein